MRTSIDIIVYNISFSIVALLISPFNKSSEISGTFISSDSILDKSSVGFKPTLVII